MKHKPTDLKEILTTGEDRVAKVNHIKFLMKGYKNSFKFTVVRRKVATGDKFYFTADSMDSKYQNHPECMEGRPLRDFVENTIRPYFPNISTTSGGGTSVTFSEY